MKRWIEGSYVKFGPRRFRALPTELMDESGEGSVFDFEPDADNRFFESEGSWCEGDDPKATLVTSALDERPFGAIDNEVDLNTMHWPVIDIDHECAWVPSTAEGHGHLYINFPVSFSGLMEILTVLEKHGIVQSGYRQAAYNRGYTAVRLPGVKKPPKES